MDIALLIDAYKAVGLEAMAQVDLEVRQNAHQPLSELGPMAASVLHAVATRVEREGRLHGLAVAAGAEERPAHVTLRAAA